MKGAGLAGARGPGGKGVVRGLSGGAALALLPLLLASLLLGACTTSPPVARVPSAVPSWMARYPVDPGSYIGIGGSPDTGDRQADLERARAKALAQLASEIEVSIRSDQTFRETESAGGGATTTAEIIVRTLTSQNLEGVELVDTFHSAKEGYWFYYRLSKQTWDALKNREMYALRDRALAAAAQAGAPGASLAERLRGYAFALSLVKGSLYAGRITAVLDGSRGALDDLIKTRLQVTLSRMIVKVAPSSLEYAPGREAELRVEVSSGQEGEAVGVLSLEIRDADGSLLETLRTDSEGSYIGALHLSVTKTGKRQCAVVLSPKALEGADQSIVSLAPRAALAIEVLPLGVHLHLAGADRLDAQWLTDSIGSILTQRFALAVLRDEADSPFAVALTVRSRNAPKNEYGIEIAYCSLSMIVTKEDSQIAALTTPESKGAGLTPEQAERNAAKGMLEALPKDPRLGEAIEVLEANAWSEKP